MTKVEKIAEKVAILLVLNLREEDFAGDAKDLATRISRAKTDPTWGRLVGAPHYSKRLARVAKATGVKHA